MNKAIKDTANDIMSIWIGFCLGWLWFTEDSFWKVLGYELLGIFIIAFLFWLVGAIILWFKGR